MDRLRYFALAQRVRRPNLGDGVEPEMYFKKYVSTLMERNTLASNQNSLGFDGMGALGMGFSSTDNPKFQAIYAMVKQATEEVEW